MHMGKYKGAPHISYNPKLLAMAKIRKKFKTHLGLLQLCSHMQILVAQKDDAPSTHIEIYSTLSVNVVFAYALYVWE